MKDMKTIRRTISVILAVMCLFAILTVHAEDAKFSDSEAKTASFRTVGNIVKFGRYEQDNDTENGPEEIEWIVLDTEGNKALLLSKYGLDCKQYNKAYVAVTWETCTLRAWLNDEFLKEAFTEEEQAAIPVTEVDNSQSQGYSKWDTTGGNNTQDKVFLLSCAEANKYLDITWDNIENYKARVVPTAYALAQGASTNREMWKTADGELAGRWWLRSAGRHQHRAAFVYGAGALRSTHVTSTSGHYGGNTVRPALWLDLDSEFFRSGQ